jgi:hypothetical protein
MMVVIMYGSINQANLEYCDLSGHGLFNIIAILLYKTGIAGIEGLRKATESRKDPVLIQKIMGCHPYLDEVVAMQNVINRQLLWVTV